MSNHSFSFANVSEALPQLARTILEEGVELGSRAGRVQELTQVDIRLLQPWQREVLTQGRKASLVAQIAETMWVLAGRSDVAWLAHYLPRAPEFSDDGKVWRGGYGPRIRRWEGRDEHGEHVRDQLRWVVDLLHHDRATRRAVINIYDPAVDAANGKDIPCNNWLHFLNRRGQLEMHVATRSNDLMWGWSGINAFEWSAIQEIVAGLVGIKPGPLHFSISSLHLYDRHWTKANRLEAPLVPLADSPRFNASAVHNYGSAELHPVERLDNLIGDWFAAEHAIRTNQLAGEELRDVLRDFHEPMLGSWLRVIAWHWTGNMDYLVPLAGTNLAHAAVLSPRRKDAGHHVHVSIKAETAGWVKAVREVLGDEFTEFVADLHAEKHEAYGDSWKRRGEQIGILANIARKVDRLGVAGGGDTAADTVIDLLVYLIKYRLWLSDTYAITPPASVPQRPVEPLSDHVAPVTMVLRALPRDTANPKDVPLLTRQLVELFGGLEQAATRNAHAVAKANIVLQMITKATPLARYLWGAEQATAEAVKEANKTRQWGAGNALEGDDDEQL